MRRRQPPHRRGPLSAVLAMLMLAALPAAAADPMAEALEHFDAEQYAEALEMLRPLAEGGHPRAQFYLGSMYYDGKGVQQDHAMEAKWIRRSADQGFAWAQNMLGRMYTVGRGVEPDAIQAHMWYDLAAGQGLTYAYRARQRLAEYMTDEEISEAVERARAWEAMPETE